jgi:RHS repeat-associated protein
VAKLSVALPTAGRRLLTAAAVFGIVVLLTAAAALAAAPTVTTAPAISGSAVEGQTLSVSPGTWANSPTGYSYQWQRCSASANASTVLANAPVGYWRLEESVTTSSVADSSASGNAGRYFGGVTLGQPGAVPDGSDRSAFLDGASGYAQIHPATNSSLSPTSSITLEAWVKPRAGQFALQKPILVKGYTSHIPPYYQYGMFLMDGSAPNGPKNLNFRLSLGGTSTVLNVNNSGWQYGVWNHVAATYDGSTMRLYLNGSLIGTQGATGNITSYESELAIGAYMNLPKNSNYLFGGGLDEVAVYNAALSSAALQQHYEAATVGICSNIAGATASTYQLGNADTGKNVRAVVTATNASGSTAATSNPLGPVVNNVVPANMTFGGANPAAPGACKCDQNAGDPVDTARGGFSESTTDFNTATYGPPLNFVRTYDSQLAQQQATAGTPGALGYGWTDNWNISLAPSLPTPSDIYRVAGSSSGTAGASGNGGAATAALLRTPSGLAVDADGNVYIADTANNRIQEIAAKTHTQWGIAMTAGDIYTIAGSASGTSGSTGNGGVATAALLRGPTGVILDASGDLYIADAGNNRIQEVAAVTSSQWGVSMTANNVYTVAGSASGSSGTTGDGGVATSALFRNPSAVALDAAGDLLIADTGSNRIRAVAAGTGPYWGIAMTVNNVYTIAGSASTTAGFSGDFGPATSALLNAPAGIALDKSNNLYIADTGNNRVQEVPSTSHTQYGIAMTANKMYTIAGDLQGTGGTAGNGGPATAALLQGPKAVAINSTGDVYIADTGNNRLQEIAISSGEQWGQGMTASDIYTIAGSAAGSSGSSGDGGVATSALLHTVGGVATDSVGNAVISDQANNTIRLAASQAAPTLPLSPAAGAVAVTLGTGSQVVFVPSSAGACVPPYVGTGAAGTYCSLPAVTASLTFDSGAGTWEFVTHPYSKYTFDSSGRLIAEAGTGGAELSIVYNAPVPGSGRCPSAATVCNTVMSASGRTLVIGRAATGFVTAVVDPLGRSWTYTYCASPSSTCTNGDLVSATDPLGRVTSYGYDANNADAAYRHDLVTLTKPNGQVGGSHAGASLTNAYDSNGRVESQTDPAGNQMVFDYSQLDAAVGDGHITTTDPAGNETKYVYSGAVLTSKVEGYGTSDAATWESTPDPATLLPIGFVDGAGNTSSSTYDASGNATSITDGLGTTATTTYNVFDEPTCEASPLAASSCSSLAPPTPINSGTSTITPPASAPPPYVTYHEYDTDGNLIWTTTGVYSPGSSSPSGQRTTYQLYNGQSVMIGTTPDSCAASAPAPSLPCARIDANGVVTQLSYSASGDLISTSTPDGNAGEFATTTYGYDADGERTTVTLPNGNISGATAADFTTTLAYNDDGELTSFVQGHSGGGTVARTTSYTYDDNGNKITQTDARGKITSYAYTAIDQLATIEDPHGNTSLTCYDSAGNVAQRVPPAGVAANSLTAASCPTSFPSSYGVRLAADATTFTYGYFSGPTTVTTPAPAGLSGYETTTYNYDGNGQLKRLSEPPTSTSAGAPNQVTSFVHDGDGRLVAKTAGDGTSDAATTTYCYDPVGQLTAVVAPDGNVPSAATCSTSAPYLTGSTYQTTYSYDSLGQTVSRTQPATASASAGRTTTYTYDPVGNLLSTQDANGVTSTRSYTPLNKLATLAYSGGSAPGVSYAYDANGNRTSMVDGTGTSGYTYNTFDELTSLTNGGGQAVSYTYNDNGQTTGVTYPLGAGASWAATPTVSFTYDDAGLLTAVTDFNGDTNGITNTADGLPATLSLGATGDTITTAYDPTDAPSSISLANSSSTLLAFAYGYHPSGAIASETDTPASARSPATYSYDAQTRVTQMTPGSDSTMNYSFDASGNLTTLPGGATATYDDNSELTSSTLGSVTTTYAYDADGQRTQSVQGGTTLTAASYDGAQRLISYDAAAASMTSASYDGDGLRGSETTTPSGGSSLTDAFVWDPRGDVPRLLADSHFAYIYGPSNVPFEQVDLSTGTVRYLVSDSLGSIRGIVDAAGALTASTAYDAWGNPDTAGGLTSLSRFGYAGGYVDATGLVYLIHRYYDPGTGQFLSVDPVADLTEEPYIYAGDDPVNSIDPTGLCASAFAPSDGSICDELWAKMYELANADKRPGRSGPHGVLAYYVEFFTKSLSHEDAFLQMKRALEKRIDLFKKNKCDPPNKDEYGFFKRLLKLKVPTPQQVEAFKKAQKNANGANPHFIIEEDGSVTIRFSGVPTTIIVP